MNIPQVTFQSRITKNFFLQLILAAGIGLLAGGFFSIGQAGQRLFGAAAIPIRFLIVLAAAL